MSVQLSREDYRNHYGHRGARGESASLVSVDLSTFDADLKKLKAEVKPFGSVIRAIDYIPMISFISGVAHFTLACFALAFMPLAPFADVVTLSRYNLTGRAVMYGMSEMTRGVLCFIPFLGNFMLYVFDKAQEQATR